MLCVSCNGRRHDTPPDALVHLFLLLLLSCVLDHNLCAILGLVAAAACQWLYRPPWHATGAGHARRLERPGPCHAAVPPGFEFGAAALPGPTPQWHGLRPQHPEQPAPAAAATVRYANNARRCRCRCGVSAGHDSQQPWPCQLGEVQQLRCRLWRWGRHEQPGSTCQGLILWRGTA